MQFIPSQFQVKDKFRFNKKKPLVAANGTATATTTGKTGGKTSGKPRSSSGGVDVLDDARKKKICDKAYLGAKGYTIPKDELARSCPKELTRLYADLFCKP